MFSAILLVLFAPAPLPPDVTGKWICECRAGTWFMTFHADGTLDQRDVGPSFEWIGRWRMGDTVLHIRQRQATWRDDVPDDTWDVELRRGGAFLEGYSELYGVMRLRRVR